MKNKIEQKLDMEFKRMNVKTFIYHFFEVSPFHAIEVHR